MIILVIIALVGFTGQTQTNYPLLTIDFQTNQSRSFHEMQKQIESTPLGEFISMKYQNCTDIDACPQFKIYDPFGSLLEQYIGIATSTRYMDMIQRNIKISNYPLTHEEDSEKLRDEQVSMKVFEERRKLQELSKSEDWAKATPTHKKKGHMQHKPINHVHKTSRDMHKVKPNLRGQEDEQGASKDDSTFKSQDPKINPEVKGKDGPKFQNLEHLFAWKVAFICMTAGLYFGMKYLKHQQRRIKKLNNSNSNSTILESHDETQSFNSD